MKRELLFVLRCASGLVPWLTAFSAGCGGIGTPAPAVQFNPWQPVAVAPDAAASPQEIADVAAALALWNDVAGTSLALAPASDGAPALPIHFESAADPDHGLYDGSGQIFVNRDLTGHDAAVVIAHELGHAFGLRHVAADLRPSVMNPDNLSVEPTAADVSALRASAASGVARSAGN